MASQPPSRRGSSFPEPDGYHIHVAGSGSPRLPHSIDHGVRRRRPDGSHLSSSDSSVSSVASGNRRNTRTGRNSSKRTAAFPANQYEFEWCEPSFFGNVEEKKTSHPADPPADQLVFGNDKDETERKQKDTSFHDERAIVSARQTAEPFGLAVKLERFVLMEVAWGTHQITELYASDIIRRIRSHRRGVDDESRMAKTGKSKIGEVTFRDIRQIFAEGLSNPSLEVRQNCIVICVPPITALVLHDRCVVHLNEELNWDDLILKLETITKQYSSKFDEIEEYYLHQKRALNRPGMKQVKSNPLLSESNKVQSMIFGHQGDSAADLKSLEDSLSDNLVPRFVSFPLEFAMLEVLVSSAFQALNEEISALEPECEFICKAVLAGRRVQTEALNKLHWIREPVEAFLERIADLGKALNSLLKNPEDLYYMDLTKLYYHPEFYKGPDGEDNQVNPTLEILIEFFEQEVSQLAKRGQKLIRLLTGAERHLSLTLALKRAQLQFWEVGCGMLTVGLGAGSTISGTFGMNLYNRIEEDPYAFNIVTGWIILSALVGVVVVCIYHRKCAA